VEQGAVSGSSNRPTTLATNFRDSGFAEAELAESSGAAKKPEI